MGRSYSHVINVIIVFSIQDSLIRKRIHTGEKPFPCEQCGEIYSERATLINHQRVHTALGRSHSHVSNVIKSFSIQNSLIRHQRVHSGEKPYSCRSCEKTFTKAGSLKKHERIHGGEKPYSCSS